MSRPLLSGLLAAAWLLAGHAAMATPACLAAADGCRVALTPAAEAELEAVQIAVNATLQPESDREAFGVAEYWVPLAEGQHGDCDDYALTKLHLLLGEGWPRQALRLTLGTLPDGEDHLVLAVRTDRGDYILDNLRPAPEPWSSLPYHWRGQEVPGSGAWRTVAGG